MTLLHPLIFYSGLAAVSIPILIHLLLRRRRRPVPWAAMRFLLEAHRRRRRRRTLEQILLLAARCLLVAALAGAIARPMFAAGAGRGPSTTVLVIDNSLTSGLTDGEGHAALDRHKQTALEMLDRLAAGPGDRVAVITAAAPASGVISPATLDIDAARRQINAIEPADSAMDLPRALALASASVPPDAGDARGVLISDWRRGSGLGDPQTDPGDAPDEPARRTDAFSLRITPPAEGDAPNLRLVSLTTGRGVVLPGDPAPVSQAIATIVREGADLPGAPAVLTVEADGGDSPRRVVQPFTLPAGERTVTVPVTLDLPRLDEGEILLRARVHTDAPIDGIGADSVVLRTLRLRRVARVGVVHARRGGGSLDRFDAGDWVRTALKPDPLTPVEIREINAPGLTPADLAGLDAAVLTRPDLLSPDAWRACAEFHGSGGTLVVFPPAGVGVHRWPDAMLAVFGFGLDIDREATHLDPPAALEPDGAAGVLPLLSGDLAALAREVTVSIMLRAKSTPGRTVLRVAGGGPFLFVPVDRLWVFASAPDTAWTDLPAEPLMLPLVQEIVRQSAASGRAPSTPAGIPADAPRGTVELVNGATGARLIAPAGSMPAPDRAGGWTARGARGETLGLLAVSPDHRAGRTDPLGVDRVLGALRRWSPGVSVLEEQTEEAADAMTGESPGWILFTIAAGLALLELIAARFASSTPGGDRLG